MTKSALGMGLRKHGVIDNSMGQMFADLAQLFDQLDEEFAQTAAHATILVQSMP